MAAIGEVTIPVTYDKQLNDKYAAYWGSAPAQPTIGLSLFNR